MGGATLVDVKITNNKSINLLICEFSKSPIRVYAGDWGEFINMQISWKDENALIINNKEYYIK